MALLLYLICRYPIHYNPTSQPKHNKGKVVALEPYVLSHIYKELDESQARVEDQPFMRKEKNL